MPLKQVPLKVCPLFLRLTVIAVCCGVCSSGVRIVGGAACGRHRVPLADVGLPDVLSTLTASPVSVPYPADSCLVLTTENVLRVSFHVCFLGSQNLFSFSHIRLSCSFCSRLSPDWVFFGWVLTRNYLIKHFGFKLKIYWQTHI